MDQKMSKVHNFLVHTELSLSSITFIARTALQGIHYLHSIHMILQMLLYLHGTHTFAHCTTFMLHTTLPKLHYLQGFAKDALHLF